MTERIASGDLCWACDGTGERDWLSGAKCYECNGTGWLEDDLDESWEDDPNDPEPAEVAAILSRGGG